jgi:type VI secretion system protein ImpF
MARLSTDLRLIPSILDRLVDLEPERTTELPANRTQVLHQMKASVGRDLQNLLNTRCRATKWPERLEQLSKSLMSYGIPDCVGINTGSREQQETLRQMIQHAVELFEPRLVDIQVTTKGGDDPADRTLRFRIDAKLKVDPAPEPVIYDSRLDATVGDFSVQGVRR